MVSLWSVYAILVFPSLDVVIFMWLRMKSRYTFTVLTSVNKWLTVIVGILVFWWYAYLPITFGDESWETFPIRWLKSTRTITKLRTGIEEMAISNPISNGNIYLVFGLWLTDWLCCLWSLIGWLFWSVCRYDCDLWIAGLCHNDYWRVNFCDIMQFARLLLISVPRLPSFFWSRRIEEIIVTIL